MPDRKPRERVIAEITLPYVTQVAAGIGRDLSPEEAMAFLNQEGHAYAMWKQMMRAGEDYIKHTLRGGRTIQISHPAPHRGRAAV
jgi:hypothetical protein